MGLNHICSDSADAHLDVGTEQALPHRKDQQLLLGWQEGDLCHLSSQEPVILSIWPSTLLLALFLPGSVSALALEEKGPEATSEAWLDQWRQWHAYMPLHLHIAASPQHYQSSPGNRLPTFRPLREGRIRHPELTELW